MVRQRDEGSGEPMIDVTYRQSVAERELVAVLQKLYLCASVEFLLAVTDFFLQALPQSSSVNKSSALSDKLPLRETSEPQTGTKSSKTRACPVSVLRSGLTLLVTYLVSVSVSIRENKDLIKLPELNVHFNVFNHRDHQQSQQ